MGPVEKVKDYAIKLFKAMHSWIGIRLPREVSAQLYKAGSAAHFEETLRRELGRIFNGLREEHPRFLAEKVAEV